MPQTVRTTLEQGRAKYAYECAEDVVKNEKIEFQKKYRNGVVKKVPMMIKTNGLGATLAFAKAKGSAQGSDEKRAWNRVYVQINDWLNNSTNSHLIESNSEGNEDLVYKVINLSSNDYRALTIEVLAFFNWLRRFAEGLIAGEDE